jgi:hypothetical protein
VAAGYFCRLEVSSNGRFQTALLSDLTQIARDYIKDMNANIPAATLGFSNTSYTHSHSHPREEFEGNQQDLVRQSLPLAIQALTATDLYSQRVHIRYSKTQNHN